MAPSMLLLSRSTLIGLLASQLASANPTFSTLNGESPVPGALASRNFAQGSSIDSSHYNLFTAEYLAGQEIAKKAKTLINEDNYYYELFIPSKYTSAAQAKEYNDNFLSKFVDLGGDSSYTVTVEYHGTSKDPKCRESAKPGYLPYAYTEGKTITLCDKFFSQPATSAMTCDNEFLDEYETGAMTILHEFTHLSPAYFSLSKSPNPPFEDYEYGSSGCRDLAESSPDEAIVNADNWMFVTLGAYWSDKCGKQIEPDDPTTGVYAGTATEAPGCFGGAYSQWIIAAGGSCDNKGVASNSKVWGGPAGCSIPHTGGMDGINVADCWLLPQDTTAVELQLAVTNATQASRSPFSHPSSVLRPHSTKVSLTLQMHSRASTQTSTLQLGPSRTAAANRKAIGARKPLRIHL